MRYDTHSAIIFFTDPSQNHISPKILHVVALRIQANNQNDHLLLSLKSEEVGPFEPPWPREVSDLETLPFEAKGEVPHRRIVFQLPRTLMKPVWDGK